MNNESVSFYKNNIDKKCSKFSRKPFLSKAKINTIKDVIIHPVTKESAYTFEEDNSYVECKKCKIEE